VADIVKFQFPSALFAKIRERGTTGVRSRNPVSLDPAFIWE